VYPGTPSTPGSPSTNTDGRTDRHSDSKCRASLRFAAKTAVGVSSEWNCTFPTTCFVSKFGCKSVWRHFPSAAHLTVTCRNRRPDILSIRSINLQFTSVRDVAKNAQLVRLFERQRILRVVTQPIKGFDWRSTGRGVHRRPLILYVRRCQTVLPSATHNSYWPTVIMPRTFPRLIYFFSCNALLMASSSTSPGWC